MYFSVVASLFLTWSCVPDSISAKYGAHKGAHACNYFSVNYIAKCLFTTFATKNLACCSMGTEDRN